MMRGIRGAIDVAANDAHEIISATEVLMRALIESNGLRAESVNAVFFTVTPDLNATFPAAVRSKIGWELVPFLCGQEIPVTDAPSKIIRVMVLCETELNQSEIQHQYLGKAASLRPDLRKDAQEKEP